ARRRRLCARCRPCPDSTRLVETRARWASAEQRARHPVVAGSAEDGVGGLQAGDRGSLDAPGVEAVVGPVAAEDEVVVSTLVGTEPIGIAARCALHVAVGGVDVGEAELRVDSAAAALAVANAMQLPAKRSARRSVGQ